MAPLLDVLVPTFNRPAALAITLTSLTLQSFRDFRVLIADQNEEQDVANSGEVQAINNVLRAHGQSVTIEKNLPRRGIAQQRQFLLDHAAAPYVLFLDDDVLLESYTLKNCVLFDAKKLRAVGGFSFWKALPASHAGEDVLAQLRVMEQYGGCGIIPSGVYHLQLPTIIPDRTVDAPLYLEIEVKKND